MYTATIVQQFLVKKRVPVLNHTVYSPSKYSRYFAFFHIENGTERRPVQKYFKDPEVFNDEIEHDIYSWVRESNDTT